MSGCRSQQRAAGLQLGDVNFLGRTISVRRQVQCSSIASTEIVPPKYGSERTIYVPGELTAALSAHVAAMGLIDTGAQLFRTQLGRLWQRNNAGEEWRRIRAAAELPDEVTLHTLRHTFASNLIASGCDVVTVQRAIGHAQPSITLNTYSHLWPSARTGHAPQPPISCAPSRVLRTLRGLRAGNPRSAGRTTGS